MKALTHPDRAPVASRARGDESGLTLVELMVSVVLAGILSAGLFYLLSGQSRTYSTQTSTAVAQQSLWGAMEYLQQQIRLAGYGFGGCRNIAIKPGAPPVAPLRLYNACNIYHTSPTSCSPGNTDAPDSFTIVHADLDGALDGVAGMRIVSAAAAQSDPVRLPAQGNFQACDWLMLWRQDTSDCALVVVTDIQAAGPAPDGGVDGGVDGGAAAAVELLHTAGGCGTMGALYNDPPWPAGGFPATAMAVRMGALQPRHFAIDASTDPPRLVTWTSASANPSQDKTNNFEVIADGIEDLQVSWACNATPDTGGEFDEGATDADKRNDDWYPNVSADNEPDCAGAGVTIGEVRVTIVSRSASERPEVSLNRRPAIEDRPQASATDRYLRNLLSATVRTRNLR